ncbi:MAG: sigma 54-interacting transcriptional regulator [bacterium]
MDATNGGLSLMAEGLLSRLGSASLEVTSAGLAAGELQALAVRVMQERDCDISLCEPKSLAGLEQQGMDLVVTVGPTARNPDLEIHPSGDNGGMSGYLEILHRGAPVRLHWALDDPADVQGNEATRLRAYREARDELERHVRVLVNEGYLSALSIQRQRLEHLADLMEDGVVAHDRQRRFYIFNRAAELATGYSRDDVLGRDCHEVFPPHGLCGANCAFQNGPPDQLGQRSYELAYTSPDGDQRRLKVTSRPVVSSTGTDGDVLAVIRDSTEVNELRYRLDRLHQFHGMVGASASVREVFDTIRQVATSDYPVLITGESGTGKELAAGAIHQESLRRGGPFVPVNCGALPENILESELFGHVRGAFTGAIRAKKGRFELADRGTLFLDEVGELTPAFQVKLLRVLQEQRFERVGGEKVVTVDVRIIAATNRDLREMIREGSFREDLFYRLCVVPIEIPPLRARREDFPLLVEHILGSIRQQSPKTLTGVSDEALSQLLKHHWPGNIRELINALQFASVRCDGDMILTRHLPPEIQTADGAAIHGTPSAAPEQRESRAVGGRRPKLTSDQVRHALAEAGGNKVKAAKLLGVGRATLYRFLSDNPVS